MPVSPLQSDNADVLTCQRETASNLFFFEIFSEIEIF